MKPRGDRLADLHRAENTMGVEEAKEHFRKNRFKDENEFEAWVIRILRANGWRITSMKDSRKQRWDADRGIEDVHAANEETGKLLFAELKMPGKKPTPDQEEWLRIHRAIAKDLNRQLEARFDYEMVIVRVWYPKDEQEIIDTAGGKIPI